MRLRRRARREAPEARDAGRVSTAGAPAAGAGPATADAPAERHAPQMGRGTERGPAYARGERAPAVGPRGDREGADTAPTRRRGAAGRTREAGAATAGAVGSGVLLARLVLLVAVLIALLIGAAILLTLVDANASNTIVKGIHEGANFFAGAFTGLITFPGHPERELAVDWGIALVVYLLLGALISWLIARVRAQRRALRAPPPRGPEPLAARLTRTLRSMYAGGRAALS